MRGIDGLESQKVGLDLVFSGSPFSSDLHGTLISFASRVIVARASGKCEMCIQQRVLCWLDELLLISFCKEVLISGG